MNRPHLCGMVVGAWLALVPGQAGVFPFPGMRLTVPEGFTVEQAAGPPLVMRPMMADFDEAGRLYVADSSGSNDKVEKQLAEKPHRIVRLEDTDGDGRFDRSLVFADQLMLPEGVLWHDGAIYTGAPPSIWKLEDTDGDGVADRRTEWHQGKTLTGCANDLHGPYLGPDGWLYWCKGGFAMQTYEVPGQRTIADSAAHVFRADPGRRTLDSVLAGGMDNPVEVTFTREGEVFFITTFFHHPGGGLRDALVHGIYGGVYPKEHGVLNGLQQTGELLPAMVELGPAAACAVTRYDSAVFGKAYENNLFSAEFNLRKVMRHILEPVGSTYRSRNEDFMVADNPDFHPTDVFEDADGSLLVIDTGGWYKLCCPTAQLPKPDVLGGIYRIRRTDAAVPADPRGLALDWANPAPGAMVARLDDQRPAVRQRAIASLAAAGTSAVPELTRVVRRSPSSLARLNAVWALTRLPDESARAQVRFALSDQDDSVRQAALHSVALRRDAEARGRVTELLQSRNRFHQRKAVEALGRIGDPEAVPALLAAVVDFRPGFPEDAAALRIHEHAIIHALICIGDVPRTREFLAARNPYRRRAALIAVDQMDGGGLAPSQVAPLLSSEDPVLRSTSGWIVSRHPEWGEALAAHFRQRLLSSTLDSQELTELTQYLGRLAKNAAIQNLIAEGLKLPDLPSERRGALLRVMADSGVRDVPPGWLEVLTQEVRAADDQNVDRAISIVRKLGLGDTNLLALREGLLLTGTNPDRPEALRVAALAATPGGLGMVDPGVFALLLRSLDANADPSRRAAAVKVLTEASLNHAQLQTLALALQSVGPMEINPLIEVFRDARSETVGLALVEALVAAKARSSLRPDLVQQCLDRFPESVQQAARELRVLLNADPVQQRARLDSLLEDLQELPGDVRRGQQIFNSPNTACATCHAIGYLGGRVGPDLTSIGQVRTRRDLLEALVFPSASYVRNYEPVIVTTRDGQDYSGVISEQDDQELLLTTGAETSLRIARAEVVSMRPGTVSIMPSGLTEQLSLQELADLLGFLTNTRWGAK